MCVIAAHKKAEIIVALYWGRRASWRSPTLDFAARQWPRGLLTRSMTYWTYNRWQTAIGCRKKWIPFWSPYPNVSEGKLFFASDSCRILIEESMSRLVRRCDQATMSQRKRRGHPLRVLWRTHTGLHVHYPQVPPPTSGGLDTRLFPLACRSIAEIAAARADNSTRAAPSFNVPIDYQAISIPNTKSTDIKRRMCKF